MRRLPILILALTLALPAWAEIRIAVVAPLSGPYQVLGQQIREGVQRAVDDLNGRGGLAGETIALDVEDDACKAENATAAANRAAGRGDRLVVGHICAEAATAAAEVYAENGIVLISPAVTADAFTDRRAGPGIFRLAARDGDQGVTAGTFLAQHYPKARLAVLDDGSPYAKPIADGAAEALQKAGISGVRRESYDAGAKDYEALAQRLNDDATDAVFVSGYQGDIALLVKALRAAGSSMIVMGPDSIATGQFLDLAGDDANGVFFTFFTDFRGQPDAAALVARFRAAGTEPVGFVLPAYAAVEAWAAARAASPSDAAEAVSAALQSKSFPTVLGTLSFEPDGSVQLPGFAVYRWQNGAPVPAP